MKVKDLIELLKKKDQEFEVIISKDSEGNCYSPLSDSWEGYYIPDSTYSGECYNHEDFDMNDEDDIDDFNEIKKEGKKALILTPIN